MPDTPSSDRSRAAAVPDLSGRILGDYRLLRRLGSGGMGQVYLAEQLSLKREVALKLIRFDVADADTALKRFQREAETVARLKHPNIVQIYQVGEVDGLRFMVLEYVEGRNLRHYLERRGPPDLAICLSIMRQVALALQKAHEEGIIHRDIKPENILLTRKVEVKVTDFGLSRLCAAAQPALHLTQSGMTLGTPLYMSPEQVQGKPVDHRSDIYSFGITCYHLLTGEPPFQGRTAFDVALKHVHEEPPPLSALRPDLPPELVAMVHKMMAKQPEQRYQSVREILRDLNRLRERLTPSGNPDVPSAFPAAEPHLSISGPGSSVQTVPPPSVISAAPDPRLNEGYQQQVNAAAGIRFVWIKAVFAVLLGIVLGSILAIVVATGPSSEPGNENPLTNGQVAAPNGEFHYPTPLIPRRERELLAILQSRGSKPEEVVAATLELVGLYVHQRRLDQAEQRLDFLEREFAERAPWSKGDKLSAKMEKTFSPARSIPHLSRLARAAITAFRPFPDAAQRSHEQFLKALELAASPPKNPKFDRYDRGLQTLQPLLLRYPSLGELCHEALDRNALAFGVSTLTPPVLEQLRQPPRLIRKD